MRRTALAILILGPAIIVGLGLIAVASGTRAAMHWAVDWLFPDAAG